MPFEEITVIRHFGAPTANETFTIVLENGTELIARLCLARPHQEHYTLEAVSWPREIRQAAARARARDQITAAQQKRHVIEPMMYIINEMAIGQRVQVVVRIGTHGHPLETIDLGTIAAFKILEMATAPTA